MTARTTAEIVADLREFADYMPKGPLREAADRLAELDAKKARLVNSCAVKEVNLVRSDIARLDLVRELAAIDALLPPCPTCGGRGEIDKPVLVPSNEVKPGARFYLTTPCPENGGNCDGKATFERLVAVFNAVWSDEMTYTTGKWSRADVIVHLRSVR